MWKVARSSLFPVLTTSDSFFLCWTFYTCISFPIPPGLTPLHVGSSPCLSTRRGRRSSAQVKAHRRDAVGDSSSNDLLFSLSFSYFLSSETLQYFPLSFSQHICGLRQRSFCLDKAKDYGEICPHKVVGLMGLLSLHVPKAVLPLD